MSEGHSPGPWSYRSQPHDDWGIVRAGGYVICQARDPRVDFTELSKYRGNKTDPYEANARLIAAAPELLVAARFLVKLCEQLGTPNCTEAAAARDAIAKANGEVSLASLPPEGGIV